MIDTAEHPCLECGACCCSYRVDFSVYELDDAGGGVPAALAVPVNGAKVRMRGTDRIPLRCVALVGSVGQRAHCGIYAQRPLPCRELEPGSHGCDKARLRHGLPPLEPPESWQRRSA